MKEQSGFRERLRKLQRTPSIKLFQLVDKRGVRSDDDRDRYDADRQFCAQLMHLFLARESDPCMVPSIGANALDRLYHENTEFDTSGRAAERFETLLRHTTEVFRNGLDLANQSSIRTKRKFKKLDIISVFLFVQDLSRNPQFKFTNESYRKLASHVLKERELKRTGRSTSGNAIEAYYEEWRRELPGEVGIRLDQQRAFDEEQKKQIFERDEGICQICGKRVEQGDDEYDHFPTPHSVGGRTCVENGRLVHKACHPRGRIDE